MSGKSSLTVPVTIRLRKATVAKIKKALHSPTDPYLSVGDYVAKNTERFVWRHEQSPQVKEKLVKESPFPPFVGITGMGV